MKTGRIVIGILLAAAAITAFLTASSIKTEPERPVVCAEAYLPFIEQDLKSNKSQVSSTIIRDSTLTLYHTKDWTEEKNNNYLPANNAKIDKNCLFLTALICFCFGITFLFSFKNY